MTVRVSDSQGAFFDKAFTINVQDVVIEPANQNPDSLTFADGTTAATVAENLAGATLGTLKGHDPDAADFLPTRLLPTAAIRAAASRWWAAC